MIRLRLENLESTDRLRLPKQIGIDLNHTKNRRHVLSANICMSAMASKRRPVMFF